MNFATLQIALNPIEADMLRARLEIAGFHPFIADTNAALATEGYALAIGGIRIQVPADELANAKQFLAAPAGKNE